MNRINRYVVDYCLLFTATSLASQLSSVIWGAAEVSPDRIFAMAAGATLVYEMALAIRRRPR